MHTICIAKNIVARRICVVLSLWQYLCAPSTADYRAQSVEQSRNYQVNVVIVPASILNACEHTVLCKLVAQHQNELKCTTTLVKSIKTHHFDLHRLVAYQQDIFAFCIRQADNQLAKHCI